MKYKMKSNSIQITKVAALIAFGVLIIQLSGAGCLSTDTTPSNKVDQGEVHQWYDLSYADETGTLTSGATFRIGGGSGTTVSLQSPSSVKFDDHGMKEGGFLGTSYTTDNKQPFTPVHQFVYVDGNGKTYNNTATITPVTIADYPAIVSKAQGLTVKFSGKSLGAKERVSLTVETSNPYSVEVTSVSDANAISITMSPELAKSLIKGNGTLYLTRSSTADLQSGTSKGGTIYTEFSTKKASIQITE